MTSILRYLGLVAFILGMIVGLITMTDMVTIRKCNAAGGQIITGQGYEGLYKGCIYPNAKGH